LRLIVILSALIRVISGLISVTRHFIGLSKR